MVFLPHWRRWLLAVLLFAFAALELPVVAGGFLAKPAPADVMIVLGSRVFGTEPGPMLRLRLEEAVRLYRQGLAPTIIVSGARGEDEAVAEAFAMRDYLVKQGIPGERIFTEDGSYNTYQNLANSQAMMAARGYRRAIIVSNASHIHRSLVLARDLGLEASAAPAPMPDGLYLKVRNYLREGAAMAALTLRR
ncbi:YdcF family protein [Anaeroselena agilis]|uniref:YdcF family protein n=1 Tax=Anaeroselena agilis TaxID=3063788 RepID=A0ABU3NXN6_9FIRM|nr:YdcF family protein [Selenomonadales bacterium 4137-cl]